MSLLPFVLGGSALVDALQNNSDQNYIRGINQGGIGYLQKVLAGGESVNPIAQMQRTEAALAPRIDKLGKRVDDTLGFNTGRGQQLLADETLTPELSAFNDAYNRRYNSQLQAALALTNYGGR